MRENQNLAVFLMLVQIPFVIVGMIVSIPFVGLWSGFRVVRGSWTIDIE